MDQDESASWKCLGQSGVKEEGQEEFKYNVLVYAISRYKYIKNWSWNPLTAKFVNSEWGQTIKFAQRWYEHSNIISYIFIDNEKNKINKYRYFQRNFPVVEK